MQIHINPKNEALRIAISGEDGWAPERAFMPGSLAETIADRVESDGNEVNVLRDLLEPYWTNNGFEPFDAGAANPYVGITDAPCIAEHALVVDDDGKRSIQPGDRIWWFPNYAVRNPLDVLLDRGSVEFPFGFKDDGGSSC